MRGAGVFDHPVKHVVDDVGVVAGVALHVVDTEPAVEKVVAEATDEKVISALAGQRIVAGTPV